MNITIPTHKRYQRVDDDLWKKFTLFYGYENFWGFAVTDFFVLLRENVNVVFSNSINLLSKKDTKLFIICCPEICNHLLCVGNTVFISVLFSVHYSAKFWLVFSSCVACLRFISSSYRQLSLLLQKSPLRKLKLMVITGSLVQHIYY